MRADIQIQSPSSRPRSTWGFTLFEIMISTFVAGVALLATMIVASQMTAQLRGERSQVDSVDNARVAIEELARTLRAAGAQTDRVRGQQRFVYAGPFTVGLNANLMPMIDPDGTGVPAALDPGLGALAVPLAEGESYVAPRGYTTGAETIVLTIDSDRDGYISSADASDDEDEDTDNPHDYVLKGFVYGSDGTTNAVTETGLALIRGPQAGPDGSLPEPLFRYWLDDDNDASTAAVLHGDVDGNGEFSQAEIAGLTAVATASLPLIERIDVAATAETEKTEGRSKAYRRTTLRSSVTFRDRKSLPARVHGVVFADFNQDGVRDPEDSPLANVVIQCSNGYRTKTNAQGAYVFTLSPGSYSIDQLDLPGYSSTTPNSVAISPAAGEYTRVNFGDFSGATTGYIVGTVYEDQNEDGTQQPGEPGLPGIEVQLDTGVSTTTDAQGWYAFHVELNEYTVSEIDSAGFSSSTPNAVDVSLSVSGDSVYVDFGDFEYTESGQIEGVVFLDENNNGTRDGTEDGIEGVTIMLDNVESTLTDAVGEFRFTTTPGVHEVRQVDSPDHTSSTVNVINVVVVVDETVVVEFGDLVQAAITFQEIDLADTEKVLSIATGDLGEDIKSDVDMVLGTHSSGGSNDLISWWNKRKNGSTPNSGIFNFNPDQQKWIDQDVNSIAMADLDGDGRDDIVTGLSGSSNNLAVWLTNGGGSKGQLPNAPDQRYSTSVATAVNSVELGDFDGDSTLDLAVGTRTGAGSGRLEIWHGGGGSSFSSASADVYGFVSHTSMPLGEIVALAAADFTKDGVDDLAVAARINASESRVYLFVYDPGVVPGADYYVHSWIDVGGQVQDVLALNLNEDNDGDVDIVVATEFSSTTGQIEVWHNRGDETFGAGAMPNAKPNDVSNPGGSPLSLAFAHVDDDIFPDILVGTRSSTLYEGDVLLYRTFGFLPEYPSAVSTNTGLGEIVAIAVGDFNKDGAMDLTTATRTSGATGKVVVFFNDGRAEL